MKNNVEVIKFLKLADNGHIISIEEIDKLPHHQTINPFYRSSR
jgi:hypothetical protein